MIFDLGRVLVNFDFQRGYRALEGLCPYSAAEIPRRLSTGGLVERFETGLIEPKDFVAELSAVLDLQIDYDRFCQIWSSIFAETLVPENMLAGLAAAISSATALQHQRHPLRNDPHRLSAAFAIFITWCFPTK